MASSRIVLASTSMISSDTMIRYMPTIKGMKAKLVSEWALQHVDSSIPLSLVLAVVKFS